MPLNERFDLDLHVTTGELQDWLVDDKASFVALDDGQTASGQDLLSQTRCRVYTRHGGRVGGLVDSCCHGGKSVCRRDPAVRHAE
jgi:hypothetical protein